ncbi:hypothetical protein SPBR_07920 [Sporothrix brasiliensis 5110]|uniref:Mediator of RNA polymerase II transcription subunit 9 n=1 Tax=Sporothrix brasiliensis 5110 TaxID=1398154 RepID=A0A0C2IVM3_9PEZI|nr:uncharacterized protein SPBR_07920 [Sporothrix brasiliensis 5110]KIH89037.1 hypothetical protein SPBR_07920 [Sporothrix brasiliensis 5110]
MAHPLALPTTFSPDALDTTAELAAILARLRPPQPAGSGAQTGAAAGASGGAASGAPTGGPAGGAAGDGGGANEGETLGASMGGAAAAAAAAGPPISLRDLPTATDSLKHKLQHARVQIKALPDVNRTVAAQEAEVRQLEARIEAQKAMLARLRADGVRFAAAGEQEQRDADKMEL